MTPYLFLLVFLLGSLAALFRSPVYGLYLYVYAFYFSPADTWWASEVPDVRYLFIAALITLASAILHGKLSFRGTAKLNLGIALFVFFVAWIWITSLWSITGHWQAYGRELFSKHLIITLLIVVLVRDFETLKHFVLANVIGCAWIGWQALGKTGGRLEGLAGALSDANTLGMYMATGLLLTALLFLGSRGATRWISFSCIPLILNTLILTGSRGAFVGLLGGGLVAGWYCPRQLKLRFAAAGALGLVLFSILAHDQFMSRIQTLLSLTEGVEQANETSGARLEIAKAGLRIFGDRPIGTGYKGTAQFSGRYIDPELAAAKGWGDGSRSAHNSLMSVLVDFSLVGLALYLAMFYWMLRNLRRLRTLEMNSARDSERGALIAGIAGALAVVFVAGQSSDYYYAEIQYWLLGLVAVMVNLYTREDAPALSVTAHSSHTHSLGNA